MEYMRGGCVYMFYFSCVIIYVLFIVGPIVWAICAVVVKKSYYKNGGDQFIF